MLWTLLPFLLVMCVCVLQREPMNDQLRLKVSVVALRPFKYADESKVLLDAIKAYDTK